MTTTTSADPPRRIGGVSKFVGDPSGALPPSSSAPSSACLRTPPRMAVRAQACPTAASNALRAVLCGAMFQVETCRSHDARHRRDCSRERSTQRDLSPCVSICKLCDGIDDPVFHSEGCTLPLLEPSGNLAAAGYSMLHMDEALHIAASETAKRFKRRSREGGTHRGAHDSAQINGD